MLLGHIPNACRVLLVWKGLRVRGKKRRMICRCGFYSAAPQAVRIAIVFWPRVGNKQMLTLPECANARVHHRPLRSSRGGHREFCACRITRFRHVGWRGHLLDIDRMSKAGWPKPCMWVIKRVLPSARGAIPQCVWIGLVQMNRVSEFADRTLPIGTSPKPCMIALVFHGRVDCARRVALA